MQKRLNYVNRSFFTTHTSSRILLSVLPSRITVIPSALAITNVGTPSEKKKKRIQPGVCFRLNITDI